MGAALYCELYAVCMYHCFKGAAASEADLILRGVWGQAEYCVRCCHTGSQQLCLNPRFLRVTLIEN